MGELVGGGMGEYLQHILNHTDFEVPSAALCSLQC